MSQSITIKIPEEWYEELKSISRKEGKPQSELVRESLKQYLSLQKFRDLRKKSLPFAEAEGILTDEDVFRIMK
ncbi:MAG: hypothetical protein A2Y33_15820 [Spirochaetes bacterium GWF1_51_8]|nr:MAG: hypothetical protein A2Y33_15820 [Spirochaetes bacterium GWF1_51_8]